MSTMHTDKGPAPGRVGLLVLALMLVSGGGTSRAQSPDRRPGVAKGPLNKGKARSQGPRRMRGTFFWSGSAARKRGYLGVHLHPLTNELRRHFGAPGSSGVLVAKVDADSPAVRAGIKVGDVLVELAGRRVVTILDVAFAVRDKGAGDTCQLKVVRKGKEHVLRATLAARVRPQIDMSPFFRFNPGRGDVRIQLDSKSFDEAMKELRKQMKDLGKHREIFQYFKQERDLEQRLRQMERKLRRLEKRLQSKRSKQRRGPSMS